LAIKGNASIFYAFIDDRNTNGWAGVGDDFVLAEYVLSGANVVATNVFRQAVTANPAASSYGLASVNYLNTTNEVLFTGEPDGRVVSWVATNATGPLQRQLFSAHHAGKAWHALAGVKTLEPGEGLVGLRVEPTNQSRCDVIVWPPQSGLWTPAEVPQTAPITSILPDPNSGHGLATNQIRIWDNEGNAALLELQFRQTNPPTAWSNATIVTIDGAAYGYAATHPTGITHTVVWNAVRDLGAGFTNYILLQARAHDVSLTGNWSPAVAYSLVIPGDTNGLPDWWELQYFGTTGVDPNADPDGDGFSNWQEYTADTDPTDASSFLRITGVVRESGGVRVNWQGGIEARQFLQRSSGLGGTNLWINLLTTNPPTPITNSYLDLSNPGTNSANFYRIRVERP